MIQRGQDDDQDLPRVALRGHGRHATRAPFTVDDVTFYDSKEERRLSAVFTAQAKMQLFVKALIKGQSAARPRELDQGPQLQDLEPARIRDPGRDSSGRKSSWRLRSSAAADYHGAVTHIYVHQGIRELTYLMRDYSGDVTVDDILMPVMDRPTSMKETMQAMLPIRLLAAALATRPRPRKRAKGSSSCCAPSRQTTSTASSGARSVRFPNRPLRPCLVSTWPSRRLPTRSTGEIVVLGDERYGAKIELVRERDTLLVDRV